MLLDPEKEQEKYILMLRLWGLFALLFMVFITEPELVVNLILIQDIQTIG